ncbi:MAG: FtsX-like permease family protein [Planctomycetes bacterium]|nr:FtsX-like permease family protein [Planctomycetota bacterium]MCB9884739.1 FtsX-like permease family protein [Planctomycetota bacterium]
MNQIAIKMLVGDLAKYFGILLGIGFAALLITQQSSIFTGLMSRTFAFVDDTSLPDLWVTDPEVQYLDELEPMQSTALDRVRGVPGVAWAVPMYKSLLRGRLPNGTFRSVIVVGLDDATLIGGPPKMIEGQLGDLRRSDGVILDEVSANTRLNSWSAYDADGKPAKDATRIPMKVGDVLQINDRRAVVVGLCQVSRTFQSQPVIYTTYSRALSYAPPERKQLSLILAKAVHGVDHGELAQRITAATSLRARTKAQMSWDTVMYYVKNTGIVINFGIAVLLGFLVGVAIAGQTFYNFTLDNLRYFGALKAMGGSNWLLLRMVLLQALLAGVVGYGLGVGAAALFGMRVQGTELAFRMTWHIPAISAAAVALICALSSIVSMIKVIRLEPAVVFRG